MGGVTLQEIFRQGYPAYEQTHAVPAHQRKAAQAIMQCRTAALGGHIQACPDGHFQRIWYNSCRHRACPQCAFIQVERWLAKQRARLLACDHYHVIVTMPHDLNVLWRHNAPRLTRLLLQSVRDTLMSLLADPKYLGAQPGLLAALHTWGQTLILHPHVHCLVTGGGLTPAGAWKPVRHGFLLPVRVVMAVFRGKLLAALRTAWARQELQLPDELRPQAFLNLLTRLGHPTKTRWHVHIQERYAHGSGVATYLARYMRGGPIKNARLVRSDGATVTFRYVDNHAATASVAPQRQMTLSMDAFLQRVLQHVPEPGTQVVRAWGVYQAQQAAALEGCRRQLGQGPVVRPEPVAWQSACAQRGEAHPERCPRCGQHLVWSGMLTRGGAGPPGHLEEDEAA